MEVARKKMGSTRQKIGTYHNQVLLEGPQWMKAQPSLLIALMADEGSVKSHVDMEKLWVPQRRKHVNGDDNGTTTVETARMGM